MLNNKTINDCKKLFYSAYPASNITACNLTKLTFQHPTLFVLANTYLSTIGSSVLNCLKNVLVY